MMMAHFGGPTNQFIVDLYIIRLLDVAAVTLYRTVRYEISTVSSSTVYNRYQLGWPDPAQTFNDTVCTVYSAVD